VEPPPLEEASGLDRDTGHRDRPADRPADRVPALGAGRPGWGAAPKGYVGLFKDNTVAVFDTGTNRVIRTIPVPRGPHGLVISPDGHHVYVSSDGASIVSVIDTATDKVTNSIEVGETPHGLVITPDGEYVLVAGFGTDQV
jgi:YVTN family beta-propeller protein